MSGKDHWTNTEIDKKLGILQKFYPRFLAPYKDLTANSNHPTWNLCACSCTDNKFYVINRDEYNVLTREQFNKQRIGPFDTLDAALFAAATLDGRNL